MNMTPCMRTLSSGMLICTLLLSLTTDANAGRDVTLGPKGKFSGSLVNPAGKPLANSQVIVRSHRGVVVTRTDAQGSFTVNNVGAGQVDITTPQGTQQVRAWTPGTAPPASENAAFLRDPRPGNRGGKGFDKRVEKSQHDFTNHPSLFAPLSP